jgi:hypothetical protein
MAAIESVIEKYVSVDATLHTDESAIYHIIGKRRFPGRHRTINHSVSYGVGDLHTNTVENAFSLLKRGIYGTYHRVSIKHLGRYCNEFSYRFNRRDQQKEMFDAHDSRLAQSEATALQKAYCFGGISGAFDPFRPRVLRSFIGIGFMFRSCFRTASNLSFSTKILFFITAS